MSLSGLSIARRVILSFPRCQALSPRWDLLFIQGAQKGAHQLRYRRQREYSVERSGEWVLLQYPVRIRTGELVRVDLYVSLPAPRNFVVLDDPVPGGLEPVNRDLATASEVDAEKGEFKRSASSYWFTFNDWKEYSYSRWSFYHQELRHHAARFYSEYLPAGNYHLSYVAQAIAPGEFQIGPVHAEEMYDPDVFGQGVPAMLIVESEQ